MQILVVGAGKVGHTVTAQLSEEGNDLTLIDRRSSVLENVQNEFDVITVQGNGASMETLAQAGAADADLVIAATNADEANLLACIMARYLNPNIRCIARIRDPEYVAQAQEMADTFNLALVLNPERQAAMEIASLLKMPGILNREAFAKARMEMVEIQISAGSKIAGKKLRQMEGIVHTKVLICVVQRGDNVVIPDGEFVLREGDKIYVTGEPANLRQFLYTLEVIKKEVRHVLITGGGRISYYLAQELDKAHMSVNIIESNEARCEELSSLLPHATIVNGDASSQTLLESEEMEDYDAVVSCTGLDELNIVTSMYAALSHVPLTITKLGRGENTKVLNNLPIGPLVCPKDLCTDHIVRYVRAMDISSGAVESVHKIADGKAEVLEFTVDEETKHIGEYFRNLPIRRNILIATVTSGRRSFIAGGDNAYHIGDTVVVVTASDGEVIRVLNDIFED